MPSAPSRLAAYLATATLARSATESTGPAILIVAISVLGSATSGSYVSASVTGAAAVGGPILGALIDRSAHPRRLFLVGMAVLAAGLAIIDATIGRIPLPLVITVAIVAGFGYPVIIGAWSAQVPRIVAPDRVRHALSLDASTYSIAAVAAPPLASALVVVNGRAPLWLPIVLLVLSILVLSRLHLPPAVHVGEPTRLVHDLRDGMRTLVARPALRRTTIITVIGFGGTAPFFIAAPVLSQHLTGGLGLTGVILAAFAIGGVLVALWVARHPVRRPDRTILAATLLSAFFLAGVGLAPNVPLLLAFSFLMGAAESPLLSAMFQVRTRESPARLQAQVFTFSSSLRMASFALTSAACGLLLHLGYGWVIALGVVLHVGSLVVGVVLGPRLPHRRHWLGARD